MTAESLSDIRRRNFMLLLAEWVAMQAVRGVSLRSGLENTFAAQLQVHPNTLSQWKKHRPIGKRSARHIEQRCGKPVGWLDQDHASTDAETDEAQVVEMVRELWRRGDPAARERLVAALRELQGSAVTPTPLRKRAPMSKPRQN